MADGTIISLKMNSYYVPGLKSTQLFPPQGIMTSYGLKGFLEAYCNEGYPQFFAILILRNCTKYWQFTEPVPYYHVNYDSKTNFPQTTAIIHKHHSNSQGSLCFS